MKKIKEARYYWGKYAHRYGIYLSTKTGDKDLSSVSEFIGEHYPTVEEAIDRVNELNGETY